MDSQAIALWFSNYANLATKALRPGMAARFDSFSRAFAQDSVRRRTGGGAAAMDRAATLIAECVQEAYPRLQKSAASNRGIRRAATWGGKAATILKSVAARVASKGEALLGEGQAFYVCDACGFMFVGSSAPEICPICKAPAARFVRY